MQNQPDDYLEAYRRDPRNYIRYLAEGGEQVPAETPALETETPAVVKPSLLKKFRK